MKGWKTKASGIAGILGGIVTILNAVTGEAFSLEQIQIGWGMIVAGGAVIGIGHKIEKQG